MKTPLSPGDAPRRPRLRPGTGCAVAAIVLLTGLLLGGHLIFRKGVTLVVARAVVRLQGAPAPELPAARREALDGALTRWLRDRPRGRAAEAADGRFLALAQEILQDGRLDPVEADRLEAFLAGEERGQ